MIRIPFTIGLLVCCTALAQAPATMPATTPSSAAQGAQEILGLIKEGKLDEASQRFIAKDQKKFATELEGVAGEMRQGMTIAVVDAKEDGDAAAIIMKLTKPGEREEYEVEAMARREGRWIFASPDTEMLDAAVVKKIAELRKWARERRNQLRQATTTTAPAR